MAASERRLDPRSSNLAIFAVSAAVAIALGVLTYQTIPDVQSTDRDLAIVEPAGVPPRCLEADRATAFAASPANDHRTVPTIPRGLQAASSRN